MTTSTRTRMRPEERRQQILNVALDLFARRGFEEVTIGDITSEMNIVRPTIYIYFPSTNAILDAIFDDLLNSYWQKIEPIISNSKGMPTPQTVSQIFRIILNEPHLLAILRCGGPSFQRKRHAQFDKKLNALLDIHAEQQRSPFLRPILGALIEGLAYWAVHEDAQDTEALTQALEDFVSHGLGKN